MNAIVDIADPGPQQRAPRPSTSRASALTFDRSPVGMALVGTDGRWIEVNDSLCHMLGYTPAELVQLTFQDITHPEDLDEDLALLQECLHGTRSDYRMVKRYLHADSRTVWGDLSVALVRADDGTPLHFISQILDISAHRADQSRLEQALAELGSANTDLARFAAVISHDLKTPLTATRAALELLVDHLGDVRYDATGGPSDVELRAARDLATRAESATERMAALIDALLAYTTTDPRSTAARVGGPDAARTSTATVADIAQAALADVRVLLDSSGSVVSLSPTLSAQPPCTVSAPLVRTLLVNLLTNAVKFREPTRVLQIHIDAHQDPDDPAMLLVRVGNDGPRIAAADRDHVFDYLTRGGHEATVDGFGIGLAACRRVVDWHGGRIWIEEPDAGGVDFCLTLPLAP